MSKIIKEFYGKADIPLPLLQYKLKSLANHPDIELEFEYWIQNRKYIDKDAVIIEGYTAEYIASLSEYMDGEGAFMQLIELRENPQNAIKQIKNGFKMK